MNYDNIGCIAMLDISGSMYGDAIDMVKVDAKAFVDKFYDGDQIGINAFHSKARWIYPKGDAPHIVTVNVEESGGVEVSKEKEEAREAIEQISAGGRTNISAAIILANEMIKTSDAGKKAFFLFSDGYHNEGQNPCEVLGAEPPIYIGALGNWIKEEYFRELKNKNPKSRIFTRPNPYDVETMFNEIRGDLVEGMLLCNQFSQYRKGTDYLIREFIVPADSSRTQVSVVWTNSKYRYISSGFAQNCFQALLIDPTGKTTDLKPGIVQDGYCIFNEENMMPGKWKCLIQYAGLGDDMGGTVGVVSLDSKTKINIKAPGFSERNQPVSFRLQAECEKEILEGLTVRAIIRKPLASAEHALNRLEKQIKSLKLAEPNGRKLEDIDKLNLLYMSQPEKYPEFGYQRQFGAAEFSKDGTYDYILEKPEVPGVYEAEFTVEGINKVTGQPFSCVKSESVWIG